MAFTIATANKILDKILRNTDFTQPTSLFISLHTANPGETGTTEVIPGANAYVRQPVTFAVASAKATTSTNLAEFVNMPACTVTHVGLWSASSAGVFWWGGALTVSKAVGAGDTFRIAIGDFDVTLT